jgi:hypothetical protein
MRRHGASEASPSIIHTSSIALLQERFRNLQKVKEMREGRELQRVHAADTTTTTTNRTASSPSSSSSLSSALSLGLQQAANANDHPRWFLHPDLIRPSRPLRGHACHGLGLGATGGGVVVQTTSPPPLPPSSSWAGAQNSGYRTDIDVDTSLHL